MARYCEHHDLLETDILDAVAIGLPFELDLLAVDFPQPADLTIWVLPTDTDLDALKLR